MPDDVIMFDNHQKSLMPYQKHTGAGGIETSYRVEDGFEAKTTTRNFT